MNYLINLPNGKDERYSSSV